VTRPGEAPQRLSPEERAAVLDDAIAVEVGKGGRVETHHQTVAVIRYGSGGVLLHLTFAVLTLVTCGLFVFPWIVWANTNRAHRVTLEVDERGRVSRRG
jgi:hypothetical protein